jgi:hypothetical protein
MSHLIRSLLLPATTMVWLCVTPYCFGQNGASFDNRAKEPHIPPLSLASAPDTPERMMALSELLQGKTDQGLDDLKSLAEHGDTASALLLGGIYRHKTNLAIVPDAATALRFYSIASTAGSGEGSERVAEMIEQKEVPAEPERDASWWRAKAREQGWIQQAFDARCLDWTHDSEPLRCETLSSTDYTAEQRSAQCPTDSQMEILRRQGMTGILHLNGGAGGGSPVGAGPTAVIFLVIDHAVPSEEDLLQTDGNSAIYVQTPENRWKMFPKDAPLLQRYLILTPGVGGRGRMSIEGQNSDGSANGGVCSGFTN